MAQVMRPVVMRWYNSFCTRFSDYAWTFLSLQVAMLAEFVTTEGLGKLTAPVVVVWVRGQRRCGSPCDHA